MADTIGLMLAISLNGSFAVSDHLAAAAAFSAARNHGYCGF